MTFMRVVCDKVFGLFIYETRFDTRAGIGGFGGN